MTLQVTFRGVVLTVTGRYYEGEAASIDGPGERESFEVEWATTPHGDDISMILVDFLREFEVLCLAAYHAEYAVEMAENQEIARESAVLQ